MAYSHLPYPSNPSLEQLKVIATDTVIWVSTTGSDGSGNGSESAPYASLKRAMDVAREYTIVGKAILYIRLKRGEYIVTDNINLYHPQGGNIVIEGDPAALKQRVIWRVEGYSWNLDSWGGGGHTATIRLWNGATTDAAGHTLHGFSAAEGGMYFSVMNAAIASRSGYATQIIGFSQLGQGINPPTGNGLHSYGVLFNGDRFFNAGVSHEDGFGILGIGRIHSATASGASLAVQFNTINYDCRCPGWTWGAGSAGLNNLIPWGGIPSNFPEPQYSQPNGYYGSGWTADTDYTSYPANTGLSHNTSDPYVLTTYPVVIRPNLSSVLSNRGCLFLQNGKIRAIRNIFFGPTTEPHIFSASNNPYNPAVDGLGITFNTTMSVGRLVARSNRGPAIYLENSEAAIRNLGFMDIDFPIALHGSVLKNYYEQTVNTGSGNYNYGSETTDNTPILCVNNANVGIIARDSRLDLVDPSGYGVENSANYRMDGMHISAKWRGIQLHNSSLSATSMFVTVVGDIPKFGMTILYPEFDGNRTASGGSASFAAYGNDQSNTPFSYPVVRMFMNTSAKTSGEREIGVIGNWYTSAASSAQLASLTSGAALVGPQAPTEYRNLFLDGIRIAPQGMCYWTDTDFYSGLTLGSGGTLSIRFYPTMTASGASAELIVSRTALLIRTANGTTCGWTNMSTANAIGSSAAACISSVSNYGGHWSYCQGSYSHNAILATENSTVNVLKSIWVYNGGHDAIDIRKNSRLTVGEVSSGTAIYGSSDPAYSNIIVQPNDIQYSNGTIAVTGYAGSALRVSENSSASVGYLFAKHPMHSTGTSRSGNSNDSGINAALSQHAVSVEENSTVKLMNMFCVGRMGGSTIRDTGLWTTFSDVKNGGVVRTTNPSQRLALISADRGSSVILQNERNGDFLAGSAFSLDGGTGATLDQRFNNSDLPELLVVRATNASYIGVVGSNSLASGTYPETPLTNPRFLYDVRTGIDRRIMTRSPVGANTGTVYGHPGPDRVWSGSQIGSIGYDARPITAPNFVTFNTGVTAHSSKDSSSQIVNG